MVVNDILKPRKEVIDSKINFQYALKAYKVNSTEEDRLESNPERFFETTYPSNAIRNMLSVVNDKLVGEDHQGGIVLSGSYGSGKTHALVTIYNLFKHPILAEEWIKYHNIKFNTESLKNDNNVCMLSTSEIDPDYLWKPIFSKLGFSGLSSKVRRYPTISTIEKIIGNGKTAIFIDELERWYGSIDSDNDQELLEANKMFLQNLLEVASENENLFVFIGFLEENKDLKEIINRINPRKEDMASTGDREKIIIHRLFETAKEDVETIKISNVVNEYIDEYNKTDIHFENIEKYKKTMIRYYPFHPQLIDILDDIYDSASESQSVRGEMQILADLVKKNYF
jgi:predicted AAA+ superfamily ATPase